MVERGAKKTEQIERDEKPCDGRGGGNKKKKTSKKNL